MPRIYTGARARSAVNRRPHNYTWRAPLYSRYGWTSRDSRGLPSGPRRPRLHHPIQHNRTVHNNFISDLLDDGSARGAIRRAREHHLMSQEDFDSGDRFQIATAHLAYRPRVHRRSFFQEL